MTDLSRTSYSIETFLYTASRILERAGYYGLRSILVIYLIQGTLQFEKELAFQIYGVFTGIFLISQIIGAVLGDLLIGNKIAIVTGGIVQALGAFAMCIPSGFGLYLGLSLIVLGGGLYSPNLMSNFGKLFLKKQKLMDAGFSMLFFAVNIGSFLGVLLIAKVTGIKNWNLGFITSGILLFLSVLPVLFTKDSNLEIKDKPKEIQNKQVFYITIALIAVGLFYGVYEMANVILLDQQFQLSQISEIKIPDSLWSSINILFVVPASVIAIVLWSFFYSSTFIKLAIGFLFGALTFALLFLASGASNNEHSIFLFLLTILTLNIAEVFISPVIQSTLTKNSNPKYLAIFMSLAFIAARMIPMVFVPFSIYFSKNVSVALFVGLIVMVLLGIGVLMFELMSKKTTST